MFRALVGGLLVAVGTAASLVIPDVRGTMVTLMIICAALATGLVAYANSDKKNLSRVTETGI